MAAEIKRIPKSAEELANSIHRVLQAERSDADNLQWIIIVAKGKRGIVKTFGNERTLIGLGLQSLTAIMNMEREEEHSASETL